MADERDRERTDTVISPREVKGYVQRSSRLNTGADALPENATAILNAQMRGKGKTGGFSVISEAAAVDLPAAPTTRKSSRKAPASAPRPTDTTKPGDPAHMDARDRQLQQADREAPHRSALNGLIKTHFVGATPDAKAIREIQTHLKAIGIDVGKVDGDLGPKTAQGIAHYIAGDKQFDLRADLFKSRDKLVGDLIQIGARAGRQEPLSSDDVLMVQLKMKMTGHPPVSGLTDFDGQAGPKTIGVLNELRARFLVKGNDLTRQDQGLRTLSARLQEAADARQTAAPAVVAAAPAPVDRNAASDATQRLVNRTIAADDRAAAKPAVEPAPVVEAPVNAPAAASVAPVVEAPKPAEAASVVVSVPVVSAPAGAAPAGTARAVLDGYDRDVHSAAFRDLGESLRTRGVRGNEPRTEAPRPVPAAPAAPAVPMTALVSGSGVVKDGLGDGRPVLAAASTPPASKAPAPEPVKPVVTTYVTSAFGGNVNDAEGRPVLTPGTQGPTLQPIAPTTKVEAPGLSSVAPIPNNLPRDTATAGMYGATLPPLGAGRDEKGPVAATPKPVTEPGKKPVVNPGTIVDHQGDSVGTKTVPVRSGSGHSNGLTIPPTSNYVQALGTVAPTPAGSPIPVVAAPDRPMAVPAHRPAESGSPVIPTQIGLGNSLALNGVPDPAAYASTLKGSPSLTSTSEEAVLKTWEKARVERNANAARADAAEVAAGIQPNAQTNNAWMTASARRIPTAAPALPQHEGKADVRPRMYAQERKSTRIVDRVLSAAGEKLRELREAGASVLYAAVDSLLEKTSGTAYADTARERVESGAKGQKAVSPDGAIGVAQVLPATGKWIVDKNAGKKVQVGDHKEVLKWDEKRFRKDAAYNSMVGRLYMDHLGKKYDGQYLLALAAYNCGDGNLDKAMAKANITPNSKGEDILKFVTTSPHVPAETRKYIDKNLTHLLAMHSGVAEYFTDPVPGARISSGYGRRAAPKKGASSHHQALDYAAPEGTEIVAAAPGVVVAIGDDPKKGLGYSVRLRHIDGSETVYGHMKNAPDVQVGSVVDRGDKIGLVGSTGISTGAHLHFEVIANNTFDGKEVYTKVNPKRHIVKEPVEQPKAAADGYDGKPRKISSVADEVKMDIAPTAKNDPRYDQPRQVVAANARLIPSDPFAG